MEVSSQQSRRKRCRCKTAPPALPDDKARSFPQQLQGAQVSLTSAQAITNVTLPSGALSAFRAAVEQEVSRAHTAALTAMSGKAKRGSFPCPLCPARQFRDAKTLERHIRMLHAKDPHKHPVRSFMQAAKALFNDLKSAPWDWLSPTPGGVKLQDQPYFLGKPLRYTVTRIQDWNKKAPSLHRRLKRPSREFVILSGETGGRLLRRHHPDARQGIWVSDRILATAGFVRKIGAVAIAKGARAAAVREELFLGASMTPLSHGSPSLLPGERPVSDLLLRIFLGPTVATLLAELRMTSGCLHSEFSDLSIDGTVKVTQATIGQRPQGKAGETSDCQENTCITVCGRTGALLAAEIFEAEPFESLMTTPSLRCRRAVGVRSSTCAPIAPGCC